MSPHCHFQNLNDTFKNGIFATTYNGLKGREKNILNAIKIQFRQYSKYTVLLYVFQNVIGRFYETTHHMFHRDQWNRY